MIEKVVKGIGPSVVFSGKRWVCEPELLWERRDP